MRTTIVHPGAGELKYEIRQIIALAKKVEALGTSIIWENIGDPVAKGEKVPTWIKEIVKNAANEDASFGYSPTQGVLEARTYIAKERNLEGGAQIVPDDILFFNGLGDAISTIYTNLHPQARVIGPSPAYPTHSLTEAAHAGKDPITYSLDPFNGWKPNLEELEAEIQKDPNIAGILIVNPDNPTGYVYPQETIRQIVDIARRYKLFVISDEIYSNLAYPDSGMHKLASVIGEVPGIAMRGISKEFPWPGARCGWIEFYNRDKDENFNRYAQSLIDAKTLEVCATTLPQKCLPSVMSDERYYPYLATRIEAYQKKSAIVIELFKEIPQIVVNPVQGAFYMTAVFREGVLTNEQSLPLSAPYAELLTPYLKDVALDQRFVYYLLAATGICVVPLSSGFHSSEYGFRFTLLEPDEQKFETMVTQIKKTLTEYLDS